MTIFLKLVIICYLAYNLFMDKIADKWLDYECLLAGDGQKIERWGKFILKRPDPLAIWKLPDNSINIDAIYHRNNKGGGLWNTLTSIPENWTIDYSNLTFRVAPLGFKHTGLFPEQAANWESLKEILYKQDTSKMKILNLFAYTGAASLICGQANVSETVHVDASKGMVEWAKENLRLSKLTDRNVRFIVDDCLKFILREQRRGRKYQGIIMDPPSFGRGPSKELWVFEKQINTLVEEASKLLDNQASFFLLNSYTTGYSAAVIENILKTNKRLKESFGSFNSGQLLLPISKQDIFLPAGYYGIGFND